MLGPLLIAKRIYDDLWVLNVMEVYCTMYILYKGHQRRINTKEKAKVVASVWGTEYIQFLAALTVFAPG